MARSRDISKVLSSNSTLATDAEVAAFNYLTQSSASTVYQTKSTTGLTLISKQTVTTGTSALNFNNVFDSTYKNYKIVISRAVANTNTTWALRLRVGGVSSGTNYRYQRSQVSNTTFSGSRDASTANFAFASSIIDNFSGVIDLFDPFVVGATAMVSNLQANASTTTYIFDCSGIHTTTTSYDGFEIFVTDANTWTGGSVYVYGYKE
jgi:hypothetical protein